MKPHMILETGAALRRSFGADDNGGLPSEWTHLLTIVDRRIAKADAHFTRELTAVAPRLQSRARSLTRDMAAAEDLVQETLVRAWRARHRFVRGSNMLAWTFTILRRLYLDGLRRNRFVGTYDEKLERTLASAPAQSVALELAEIERALSSLPEDKRVALTLIAVEELSYEEAAAVLGVPTGTVKSRVTRARYALGQLLEVEGPWS